MRMLSLCLPHAKCHLLVKVPSQKDPRSEAPPTPPPPPILLPLPLPPPFLFLLFLPPPPFLVRAALAPYTPRLRRARTMRAGLSML